MIKSALQIARAEYQPKLPKALLGAVKACEGAPTQSVSDQEEIKKLFPNTYGMPVVRFEAGEAVKGEPINVGVILSGGQAPGGHNVISGLFDGIKSINPESRLFGFILGPGGFVDHNYMELTSDIIDEYRNTGGFDIIGSGRTKLEKVEQFEKGLEIIRELNIKAIVIIGGDDSNTNACVLAEYYKAKNYGVQVIGCPKTIDGDLKNEHIETSFGFDTATKTYSEVIGNIQRDCNSARKYWHYIKLMGRSASHIALECALQCQPNICLISEEVEAKNQSLDDIVTYIANVVAERAKNGKNYGTVLVPEGLIEFVPAMKKLIAELNDLLSANAQEFAMIKKSAQLEYVTGKLSKENAEIFSSLPERVAKQLCADRDPHGNVQVSLIDTEQLLAEMVGVKLAKMKEEGKYVGKYNTQHHFFGYEGRCATPSNFDADYCYSLGFSASRLIQAGKTGYMSVIKNTTKPAAEWIAGGVPITMMMNMEKRNGEMKPVIQKALVKLDGAPFLEFAKNRENWALNDCFVFPGPIQYFGPSEVCDQPTITLKLEQK
ncbi:MAG: diphosphate--fructose-6-phosphate 1-phosphotransferase [Bacteroidaceae bacterium]|jgi:pyrophosphate--fructose-6-phosphate 1-phosphotransferase|uniref:diphosphate--fructose-6-phosphate 1-phosphotransferase n=1 Tax=unclassified Bacteroides TaxID=2646097 RepID=UPI0004E0BBE7|nr:MULTISPECIES: diphosphate--fructose-6-phosphate 1-phosphotransferase [unclassified Bacteroides]MBP3244387.1 diphosphate--fructose-6-phosphate 1-phosphotransferase [Bacteroidaceae bacterium]SDF65749.1 pyrophosphate-dependent phosphofructokinase [Bacteroidales bacterium KHT7]MBQ1676430.1 diphosphate--fructose-6-phosphate 1-phosphotransferase [Bacteroidaceae bacterium]MBQ3874894.1 diphosphate--fructose-6-phosphate 1-phosphotransferase [Bacteroidaceae bacterium]MBQ4461760.1 diphosphate--fructos